MRVLRDTLGERDDFARVIDWNFESEPFFLECDYGGQSLPEWAAEHDVLPGWDRDARLAFFLQIPAAVDAPHGVGVLTKDLQPGNRLLRARRDGGWPDYLTDLGMTRPWEASAARPGRTKV